MSDENTNPNLISTDPATTASPANVAAQTPEQIAATAAQAAAEAASAAEAEAAAKAAAPATSDLVTPPPANTEAVASETDEATGVVEYTPTGDARLDVTLTFLGNLGIAGTDPAVVAAANGNFGLLEAKLATMGDKATGWPQMVALAKDAYGEAQKKYGEHIASVDKAILTVAGSKENWDSIKAWAAKNAEPAEKEAINKMIDAGPIQARAAATLLLNAFTKAQGTVINPADPLRNNAGNTAADYNGKLGPREYAAEVRKLSNKLGTRMESSPEYAALRKRLG